MLPTRTRGRITLTYWGWMPFMRPGEIVEIGGRLNIAKYLDIMRDLTLPTKSSFVGQVYLIQETARCTLPEFCKNGSRHKTMSRSLDGRQRVQT